MSEYYKMHFYEYLCDIASIEDWTIPDEWHTACKYYSFLSSMDSELKFIQYVRKYLNGENHWMHNVSGTLMSLSLVSHHLWHWHDQKVDFPSVIRMLREIYLN